MKKNILRPVSLVRRKVIEIYKDMTEKLTISKILMMTTSELKELREEYNHTEHEFILYCINNELDNRNI